MYTVYASAQINLGASERSKSRTPGSSSVASLSSPTLAPRGRSSSVASVQMGPDSCVAFLRLFLVLRLTQYFQQSGAIEQSASLLKLEDAREYNEQILIRAAKSSEEADRIPEAIKLYNLAGDYATVIGVLAHALGNTIAQPSVDEKARAIERTAADILRHYERTNRAVGKERDAVIRLLRVREAMDAKDAGRIETALEVRDSASVDEDGSLSRPWRLQLMESTDLIPMDGDVGKITKRAEEFRELPDALQRNLQTFLTLTMDILATVHQKTKASSLPDVARQMVRPSSLSPIITGSKC